MVSPQRRLAKLVTSVPVLVCLWTNGPLLATDALSWPRFHGPKGDNISTETGLLTEWPERGPSQQVDAPQDNRGTGRKTEEETAEAGEAGAPADRAT